MLRGCSISFQLVASVEPLCVAPATANRHRRHSTSRRPAVAAPSPPCRRPRQTPPPSPLPRAAPPLAPRSSHPRGCRRLIAARLFTGIVQGVAEVASIEDRRASAPWTGDPGLVDLRRLRVRFPTDEAVANVQIGASVAVDGTCLTVVELPDGAERDAATAADADSNTSTSSAARAATAGPRTLGFDVVAETLAKTTLGRLKKGGRVNFERSARAGDEIGGHAVSGHIRCTAEVRDILKTPDNQRWRFTLLKDEEARVVREGGSDGGGGEESPIAGSAGGAGDSHVVGGGWASARATAGSGGPDAYMKYILPKGFVAVNGCSLTVGEVDAAGFSVYLIPETLRATTFGMLQEGDRVNIELEATTVAVVDTTERVVAARLSALGLDEGGMLGSGLPLSAVMRGRSGGSPGGSPVGGGGAGGRRAVV